MKDLSDTVEHTALYCSACSAFLYSVNMTYTNAEQHVQRGQPLIQHICEPLSCRGYGILPGGKPCPGCPACQKEVEYLRKHGLAEPRKKPL